MNILIIGGLLGLAVIAILGAILLGIGEDRAEKKAVKSPQSDSSAPPPQQARFQPATGQAAAYQSVPPTPMLSRPTGQLPALGGNEALSGLNGQVHEITGELRALANRASELEQRLNALSEALERQQPPRTDVPDFYVTETDTRSL